MSEKLQQAIAATRAGDKREAQQLLADLLEENPNDEHAWFLLGNLVDSPEKRKAYLGQALAINPQNAKAKQQFGQVQREIANAPVMTRSSEMDIEAITDADSADAADWLDEQVGEAASDDDILAVMDSIHDAEADDTEETEKQLAPVETAVIPTPSPQTEREKQLQQYNYILAFLIFLIVVVLIFLFLL